MLYDDVALLFRSGVAMRRPLLRRFEFAVAACFNTAPFGSLIGAPRRARGAGHASHVPLPLPLAAAAAAA